MFYPSKEARFCSINRNTIANKLVTLFMTKMT